MSEEVNYKDEYDKLKLESDSKINTMNNEIAQLTQGLTERDKKISELQTYICKNLTTPKSTGGAEPMDFDELYKSAIDENKKK